VAQNDILQTSCLHIVIFFHSPVFILIQCSRTPKIFLGSSNLLGGDPRQISIFIILSILKNFNDILSLCSGLVPLWRYVAAVGNNGEYVVRMI